MVPNYHEGKNVKKIKVIIAEAAGAVDLYGTGARFIHMGDDERRGQYPDTASTLDTPADGVHGDMIPHPRARVGFIEQYSQTYAFLMGHGVRASTGYSIEQIMEETGAQDPQSVAQAVADYLNDKARIK